MAVAVGSAAAVDLAAVLVLRVAVPILRLRSNLAGTVKWFNGEKGFGFVAGSDGGKDVFVHISVLEQAGLRALSDGQPVIMRVVDTPKGREAISIESDH